MTFAEKKMWYEVLRDLSIPSFEKTQNTKSPSIPLDKGEETYTWNTKDISILKNKESENEQKDYKKVKVYRQRIIENYIVDFYLPEYKIILEIDGDTHFTEWWKSYDEERTWVLEWLWLRVIRFTNDEVMNNIEWVKVRLYNEINI